jgi:hypothetical protein
VIELGEMSQNEGTEMFTRALEKRELATEGVATLTLLQKLAYLPLAIVQAASFIKMTQRPVQFYSPGGKRPQFGGNRVQLRSHFVRVGIHPWTAFSRRFSGAIATDSFEF